MDGEGPAGSLQIVAELRREPVRGDAVSVRRAQQAGLSWEAIALDLAVTEQAVHRQHGMQWSASRRRDEPRQYVLTRAARVNYC